jgi:hypothetical protein
MTEQTTDRTTDIRNKYIIAQFCPPNEPVYYWFIRRTKEPNNFDKWHTFCRIVEENNLKNGIPKNEFKDTKYQITNKTKNKKHKHKRKSKMSNFSETISQVIQLTENDDVQKYLSKSSMAVQKVSWEDISRNKNSVWGDSITDMTLCVAKTPITDDKPTPTVLCPVIRHKNYTDKSFDVPADTFKLAVDNKVMTLSEYLKKLGVFDARDSTAVLLQTQCCILPVQDQQSLGLMHSPALASPAPAPTEFCVSLYNYQANNDSPAVLAICAHKNSTSATLLKQKPTKLFQSFNNDAHWFKLERVAAVRAKASGKKEERVTDFRKMTETEKQENCIMIIQVPLVHEMPKPRKYSGGYSLYSNELDDLELKSSGMASSSGKEIWSDASIGDEEEYSSGKRYSGIKKSSSSRKETGLDMGNVQVGSKVNDVDANADTFITPDNIDEYKLKRDSKYPVRVTFQYYRASDSTNIPTNELDNIIEQLLQPVKVATAVGSLVTSGDTNRPTESSTLKKENSKSPSFSMAGF